MSLELRTHHRHARSRGFTLLEVLLVVGMIVLLAGLLLIAARYARQSAQRSADRASVTSLKTAITKFKQDFGFVPHVVKQSPDGTSIKPLALISPPNNAPKRWVPTVFDLDDAALTPEDQKVLRGEYEGQATKARRYSNLSLCYYLIGTLGTVEAGGGSDPSGNDKESSAIDGQEGPGFREPLRTGEFKKTGKKIEPMFDLSRNSKALRTLDAQLGLYSLTDSRGVEFRYYRWLKNATTKFPGDPQATLKDMNVPFVVGDPIDSPELRNANYAVVGAGPNGVFGDETESELRTALGDQSSDVSALRLAARLDNAVEVVR